MPASKLDATTAEKLNVKAYGVGIAALAWFE
jgi:hypothetical protein